jgi:hypothetical protein
MKAHIVFDTAPTRRSVGRCFSGRHYHEGAGPTIPERGPHRMAVYTNKVPGGAFRGFGVTQSCFAAEMT